MNLARFVSSARAFLRTTGVLFAANQLHRVYSARSAATGSTRVAGRAGESTAFDFVRNSRGESLRLNQRARMSVPDAENQPEIGHTTLRL